MLLVILLFPIALRAEQVQEVSLYGTKDCSGPPLWVQRDGSAMFEIPQGSSVMSTMVNGMWRMDLCNNTTFCWYSPRLDWALDNSSCTLEPFALRNTWLKLTRFGDPFQSEQVIHFYKAFDFPVGEEVGGEWAYNASTPRVEEEFEVAFFTGNYTWSVYPEPDYGGCPICWKPNPQVWERGYGFTYIWPRRGVIGSLRAGDWCESREFRNTGVSKQKSHFFNTFLYWMIICVVLMNFCCI